MLIFIILLICSPFLVRIIRRRLDDAKGKEHTTEQTAYFTTYQNENISYKDIMGVFTAQCYLYLNQFKHYIYTYQVFQGKDEQNYAWHVKTVKEAYNWAIIYTIEFLFSNGRFQLLIANNEFTHGGKSSEASYHNRAGFLNEIDIALEACRLEAIIMWKMNGKVPTEDGAPFSYLPLDPNNNQQSRFENNFKEDTKKKPSIPYDISQLLKMFGVEYPDTDFDLLKRNYYKELSKNHPDKVEHLGDELKNVAKERTQEIIANYNKLINWLEKKRK